MLQQHIRKFRKKIEASILESIIFLCKRRLDRFQEEAIVEEIEEIDEVEDIDLGANDYRVSLISVLHLAKHKGPVLTKALNTTGRWQDAIYK